MKSIKLRSLLLIGFISVGTLLAVIAAFGIYSMNSLNAKSLNLADVDLPSLDLADTIDTATGDYRLTQFEALGETDSGKLDSLFKELETTAVSIEKKITSLEPLLSGGDEKTYWIPLKKRGPPIWPMTDAFRQC